VIYLAASGVVGLSIGDQALFTAFVYIGPRIAMLIMTTAPLFAAAFGWIVLGESLTPMAWIGVCLTIGGVAWVTLERPAPNATFPASHRSRGVILAIIAAACQAGGLLLSKQGIGHGWLPRDQHLPPLAATLTRMFFAAFGSFPMLFISRARRRGRAVEMSSLPSATKWTGAGFACLGAMVGPYLGVWMSLVAADREVVGVAQTLCSLSPVLILPLAPMLYHEKIGARAIFGALIAVTGSALLFV
jgi:drug/metabolite transporter (DMT)-like permease